MTDTISQADRLDRGASPDGDRATRASHGAPSGLHHSAGIPSAETFSSIIQWGDETFGHGTPGRIIERAWEEWQEMISPDADMAIEAADVIIVLLRLPGIAEAIQRKMEINRARVWRLNGDGTGYHIPESARRVEVPFAYCCAEGGGRVDACDCVNKDHGTAWVDSGKFA